MSIIFGPGVGKAPFNSPPDALPDSTPADVNPVVFQAVPNQSGNQTEWRDVNGALLAAIDINGNYTGGSSATSVILAPGSSARNTIQATGDFVGLVNKARTAQTADLQRWVSSGGVVLSRVAVGGGFSVPSITSHSAAAGANSEEFGAGAVTSSTGALAVGAAASATTGNTTALGAAAVAVGQATAVGQSASATALGATAIGQAARAIDTFATALGIAAHADASQSIAIGNGSQALFGTSVALGITAVTTAANQVVIGANDFAYTDAYLGSGVTDPTPSGVVLNATGGSGANVAGASFTLAGGKSTGSAKGGDLLFQTSPAGGAGSGLNALATLLQLTGDNKAAFFAATPIAQQANTADLKDTICGFGFQVNSGASPLNLDGGTLTAGDVIGAPMGGVVTLCQAFTPAGTGADVAEIVVPFSPRDGTTSVTWNVRRIDFRVQTAGGAPSVRVEKSTAAGAFSAATVGDVTLGSGDFEGSNTSSLGTVASGNKLRFNVLTLATAQNWTVEVTLGATT